MFDMAFREAQKAWHRTPMLARTRIATALNLVDVVNSGKGASIATFLGEMAGSAFSSAALTLGLDAAKATSLGQLLIHMAILDRPISPVAGDGSDGERAKGAAHALRELAQQLRTWVAEGNSGHPGTNLGRVDELMGRRPEARLALTAPFASALAVSVMVADAVAANYPLQAAHAGAAA